MCRLQCSGYVRCLENLPEMGTEAGSPWGGRGNLDIGVDLDEKGGFGLVEGEDDHGGGAPRWNK